VPSRAGVSLAVTKIHIALCHGVTAQAARSARHRSWWCCALTGAPSWYSSTMAAVNAGLGDYMIVHRIASHCEAVMLVTRGLRQARAVLDTIGWSYMSTGRVFLLLWKA
jgi:hypothetical protein